MKYKHLFFDLDNTLWDFEKNSHETFNELYDHFLADQSNIPSVKAFFDAYTIHNTRLWGLYRESRITKEELKDTRFLITLQEFGIDDKELASTLSDEYTYRSPRKGILFPGTLETLDKLKDRFQLHIITNGFEEIQHVKLEFAGLTKYFENMITSEQAQSKKPDARIFNYAMELAGASAEESLMIGDDLDVDIIGAREIGMDTILFDPFDLYLSREDSTPRVTNIPEILTILDRLN